MGELFLRFLRADARQADALYILGDLFEHWIGDDALDEPFNAAIADGLRDVGAAGVPVHVMHGNRDFLLGHRFERATGARLLGDTCVIDLHGHRTLLMHGDTLCTDDVAYQRFRGRVRHPWFQRAFLALPRAMRLAVAQRARRMSEEGKSLKNAQVMDVTEGAVIAALRDHRCARMIHGHTHRPATHAHAVDGHACERIVLADWYEKGEYLRCDAQGCERRALE